MGFSQKISVCLRASLVAALWGVVSLSAQAQSIANMFDAKTQNILSSVGSALAAPQGNTGKAASSAGKSAVLDVVGALGSNANGSASNYKYRYDPKVSVNVRNGLAKAVAKEMGMSEKEVLDNILQANLLEEIGKGLESKGYAKHSLATAKAVWMVLNLEIVYGTEFTDEQDAATVRQVEQHMAATPGIEEWNDETKQYIAETFMWLATLQYIAYEEVKKSAPEKIQSMVQGARESLAVLKINPDDFRLTAGGLVAR